MKSKDISGLALRLLGLVFFHRGVVMLPVAFMNGWTCLHIGWFFALGWWLVGGAKLLRDRADPASSAAANPPVATEESPPRRSN